MWSSITGVRFECNVSTFLKSAAYAFAQKNFPKSSFLIPKFVLDGSFELGVKFTSEWAKATKKMTKYGKVQNMDPLRGPGPSNYGPGPWTTFMDRVHGPPFFTTPKITEVNKNKIKRKIKKVN